MKRFANLCDSDKSKFLKTPPLNMLFMLCLLFSIVRTINAEPLIYIENGDAGNLLNTAQSIPAGINQVNGTISFNPDVDLYKLIYDTTSNVSVNIWTDWYGSWFDTDVTIFNQNGNPLLVMDSSYFVWSVTPGTYYFAIADWNIAAVDSSGNIIADDYYSIFNPSGVLGGWRVTSSPYRTGPYEISFSISTVPEPATVLLLGLGALFLRKRK